MENHKEKQRQTENLMKFSEETYEKIENGVVEGYKKIETTVVDGYKKIEEGVVNGFNGMNDKIIKKVFSKQGETVEETKKRLSDNK